MGGGLCVPHLLVLRTQRLAQRRQRFGAVVERHLPAAAHAEPSWDPKRDFMVGPEKNAINDYEIVPMQMAGTGKIDVNNALITEYKQFPGMYPHAAGLIASHGPYRSVSDLMKIDGATDRDKELFRKYKAELVAMPPGRQFYERINSRQST